MPVVSAVMTCSVECFVKMLDSFEQSGWLGTWRPWAESDWFGVDAGGTCSPAMSQAFLRQVGLLRLPCP